jgi:hypothetical protein
MRCGCELSLGEPTLTLSHSLTLCNVIIREWRDYQYNTGSYGRMHLIFSYQSNSETEEELPPITFPCFLLP